MGTRTRTRVVNVVELITIGACILLFAEIHDFLDSGAEKLDPIDPGECYQLAVVGITVLFIAVL